MIQQTIRETIRFSGIGLHTGLNVNVRIIPACENTGVIFIRKDLPGSPVIKAEASSVVATSYATSLGSNGASVGTVEHLLAALRGMGVDNAAVEIDGPEVPVMDGSASHFIEMIEDAGLMKLSSPRRYLVIKKPIRVGDNDKFVVLLPEDYGAGLTIDYSIDFAHPMLKRQSFSRRFSGEVFRNEVGNARTFGFLSDVEMLRANGLAKGGSLNNAIVIGETKILNEGGLRFPDEFVRHKVLDLLGDISLLGYPVIGRIEAHRSGHALNFRLVKEVLDRPNRWDIVDSFALESPASPAPSFLEKAAAV